MIQKTRVFLGAALLLTASMAHAVNLSFDGMFSVDNEVQLFNFTTDGVSTVYLTSYGYAGGTGADGGVHAAGGMDTILSLFDNAGNLVNQNDDGSTACFTDASAIGGSYGNNDPVTGSRYDTCLSSVLTAGDYTVAVTQYDNFAFGPTFADGFFNDASPNFTAPYGCSNGAFCDVNADNRTASWAFDILNVVEATQVPVPAPAGAILLGLGMVLLGRVRR